MIFLIYLILWFIWVKFLTIECFDIFIFGRKFSVIDCFDSLIPKESKYFAYCSFNWLWHGFLPEYWPWCGLCMNFSMFECWIIFIEEYCNIWVLKIFLPQCFCNILTVFVRGMTLFRAFVKLWIPLSIYVILKGLTKWSKEFAQWIVIKEIKIHWFLWLYD